LLKQGNGEGPALSMHETVEMQWPSRPAIQSESVHMGKLILLATSLVALAATAAPAFAITPASFEVTGGGLTISAPTGANVDLGARLASNVAGTISGSLGVVTVSDLRGGATTWTASVISSAFTPTAGPAVAASLVSYNAGVITPSGPVTAVGGVFANLTGVVPVVTGTSTGPSSATWNPLILVAIAANLAPGIYTATVTHSVA
jgi:hypothetical protein